MRRCSSNCGLQRALGRFDVECEAGGIRVSASKSETSVLCRKMVNLSLWFQGELLTYVKGFKVLCVLFMSESNMDRQSGERHYLECICL